MTNTSNDRGQRGGVSQPLVLVFLLALTACSVDSTPRPHLANPASQNCIDKGGKLVIDRQPDGGQYDVCVFGDDRHCEEWAPRPRQCRRSSSARPATLRPPRATARSPAPTTPSFCAAVPPTSRGRARYQAAKPATPTRTTGDRVAGERVV